MNRLVLGSVRRLVPLTLALVAAQLIGAGPASAATLKVCSSGCPYSQLAPALAMAKDGDTIEIGPGTYSGGVTVDVSVKIVGAGAGSTIISGGGSVLTIGSFGADAEPTVSIDGVSITGGVAQSSPESVPFTGQEGVWAAGGGVEIPPNAQFTGGATVTISNSAITGNRVAPTATLPFGPPCPSGPCPFALAAGGGVDNWGTLTLDGTTISNNRVGSASGLSALASDAYSGAIQSWLGPLTISNSVITGNHAGATAPNGRFADSGGIFLEGGTLVMSNSSVSNNSATLEAGLPDGVDLLAIAGGIHLSENVSTGRINNTTISGNSASMTNTVGYATAFSGGLHVDVGVKFGLSNSILSANSISAATVPGSSGSASGDSAAGELHGTINNTRFTGNTVTVSSVAGDANAVAGASIFYGSISNSLVGGNHVQASSPQGAATVMGGGLLTDEGGMTLRNSTVSGNGAAAEGGSAIAQGGGIFDAPIPNGPPGGPLRLRNCSITGNSLAGSVGATLQGGGLYIQSEPLTQTSSVIAQNVPDQCFGCGGGASAIRTTTTALARAPGRSHRAHTDRAVVRLSRRWGV